MVRLRASKARYALVERQWWIKRPDETQPILNTLVDSFRLVRFYGALAILEREPNPARRGLRAISQRLYIERPRPADVVRLQQWIREWPDEPLPWELLGRVHLLAKHFEPAAVALERAFELDPANSRTRELAQQARSVEN